MKIKPKDTVTEKQFSNNDLLTGLLGPYQDIRSPIFFVRPELSRALRKSEGSVFLVRNV